MGRKKRIFREWQHPRDGKGRFAKSGSSKWAQRAFAAAEQHGAADFSMAQPGGPAVGRGAPFVMESKGLPKRKPGMVPRSTKETALNREATLAALKPKPKPASREDNLMVGAGSAAREAMKAVKPLRKVDTSRDNSQTGGVSTTSKLTPSQEADLREEYADLSDRLNDLSDRGNSGAAANIRAQMADLKRLMDENGVPPVAPKRFGRSETAPPPAAPALPTRKRIPAETKRNALAPKPAPASVPAAEQSTALPGGRRLAPPRRTPEQAADTARMKANAERQQAFGVPGTPIPARDTPAYRRAEAAIRIVGPGGSEPMTPYLSRPPQVGDLVTAGGLNRKGTVVRAIRRNRTDGFDVQWEGEPYTRHQPGSSLQVVDVEEAIRRGREPERPGSAIVEMPVGDTLSPTARRRAEALIAAQNPPADNLGLADEPSQTDIIRGVREMAQRPDNPANSYESMGRTTLMVLARQAGINPRGKSNGELAAALKAKDDQKKAKLNPSAVGHADTSGSAESPFRNSDGTPYVQPEDASMQGVFNRHRNLTREQFDGLSDERKAQVLADLRKVRDSKEEEPYTIPSNRSSMGMTVRGRRDAAHVTGAQAKLRELTYTAPPPVDNSPAGRAKRLNAGDRFALEGATMAELADIAREAGRYGFSPSWKRQKAVDYLRNQVAAGDRHKAARGSDPDALANALRGATPAEALATMEVLDADGQLTIAEMKKAARALGVKTTGDKRSVMHALAQGAGTPAAPAAPAPAKVAAPRVERPAAPARPAAPEVTRRAGDYPGEMGRTPAERRTDRAFVDHLDSISGTEASLDDANARGFDHTTRQVQVGDQVMVKTGTKYRVGIVTAVGRSGENVQVAYSPGTGGDIRETRQARGDILHKVGGSAPKA